MKTIFNYKLKKISKLALLLIITKRIIFLMNTQIPCPFCSSKNGYIYTQSHYQCLECKRVVDDCCNGEVMNCYPQKDLIEDD